LVTVLKHFLDVLHDSFRGKRYTYRTDEKAPVPASVIDLWRDRGYDPGTTGLAYVRFGGADKEYAYPLYFWGEV